MSTPSGGSHAKKQAEQYKRARPLSPTGFLIRAPQRKYVLGDRDLQGQKITDTLHSTMILVGQKPLGHPRWRGFSVVSFDSTVIDVIILALLVPWPESTFFLPNTTGQHEQCS